MATEEVEVADLVEEDNKDIRLSFNASLTAAAKHIHNSEGYLMIA